MSMPSPPPPILPFTVDYARRSSQRSEDSARQDSPGSPDSRGLSCGQNVGDWERIASLAGGAMLAAYGLFKAQRGRLPLAALGAMLAGRGATGRCQMYAALGVDTAHPERTKATVIPAQHGEKVEKAVTINRPASELFAFWRDLKNLPRIMQHLKSVEVRDDGRSHWVAEGPLGRTAEWDAEVLNERANELIAWESLPGSAIDTAGSVRFKELPGKRGTTVTVSLKYNPPAGKVGAWAAWLLGDDPQAMIAEDLRRFKQVMEAGETATVDGQPSGREEAGRGGQRSQPSQAQAHQSSLKQQAQSQQIAQRTAQESGR
jgi:uncharacterized membrane protein